MNPCGLTRPHPRHWKTLARHVGLSEDSYHRFRRQAGPRLVAEYGPYANRIPPRLPGFTVQTIAYTIGITVPYESDNPCGPTVFHSRHRVGNHANSSRRLTWFVAAPTLNYEKEGSFSLHLRTDSSGKRSSTIGEGNKSRDKRNVVTDNPATSRFFRFGVVARVLFACAIVSAEFAAETRTTKRWC